MAEHINAYCSICGKGYHMCLSCKDEMRAKPWKMHTDTSEHYKVFQILRGFSTGVYTKEEAKEKFDRVDLSDIDSFREHIKNAIKDIINDTDVASEDEHSDDDSSAKTVTRTRKKRVSKKNEEEIPEVSNGTETE